jgi:predicted RNA methylase
MEDLFPYVEGLDFNRLKTTEEGLYSITRRRDAVRILNVIRSVVGNLADKTVTDATACIGGDTINFGLNCKFVRSIELNRENYEALANNVGLYDLKNVETIHDDCLSIFNWKTDILFIDPPWGGPDYKTQKDIDLFLSDKRIDIWIEEILKRPNRPGFIFIKLPCNYNFKRLNFLPNVDYTKAYQIRSYTLVSITVFIPEKRIHQGNSQNTTNTRVQ